jgi:3-oxoacyl-[acyl-carrier-protein] synthase III
MPGIRVPTADIARRMVPPRDPNDLVAATGISTRHHVPDARHVCTSLGSRMLETALEHAQLELSDLRRLIFVSSHGGDRLIPSTATSILAELGVREGPDAYDLNNACMGFLTALDVAGRAVATGIHPIGIVVAEILSPYVTGDDPRAFAVLGDAVVAVIVDRPTAAGPGILGSSFRTLSQVAGVELAHPGLTSRRETIHFAETNRRLGELAIEAIVARTHEALQAAEVELSDVDWFLPHQPNGRMYEAFCGALNIPDERTVPIVDEIGSVGAASIPISLDRLLRERDARVGQLVLLAGVGAGGANGAVVLRL